MNSNSKVNGKTLARRGKTTSKSEGATTGEAQTQNPENSPQVMSLVMKDKAASDRKQAGIQLYQRSGLPDNRPIGSNTFQVRDTISASGIRPIGSSSLQISDTLSIMGNRPIQVSALNIIHTMLDNRPVTADDFQIRELYTESGSRPIGVSTLKISDLYSAMGNRPVASNDIDDSAALMGFID